MSLAQKGKIPKITLQIHPPIFNSMYVDKHCVNTTDYANDIDSCTSRHEFLECGELHYILIGFVPLFNSLWVIGSINLVACLYNTGNYIVHYGQLTISTSTVSHLQLFHL